MNYSKISAGQKDVLCKNLNCSVYKIVPDALVCHLKAKYIRTVVWNKISCFNVNKSNDQQTLQIV